MLSKHFTPTNNVNHAKVDGYTASATLTTDPIFMEYASIFAITASWTGGGTGTFTIQGCNDKERIPDQGYNPTTGIADPNLVNWYTLGNSSMASSLGSPITWNYSNQGARWIRVVYTVSGGSIVLTLKGQLKGTI